MSEQQRRVPAPREGDNADSRDTNREQDTREGQWWSGNHAGPVRSSSPGALPAPPSAANPAAVPAPAAASREEQPSRGNTSTPRGDATASSHAPSSSSGNSSSSRSGGPSRAEAAHLAHAQHHALLAMQHQHRAYAQALQPIQLPVMMSDSTLGTQSPGLVHSPLQQDVAPRPGMGARSHSAMSLAGFHGLAQLSDADRVRLTAPSEHFRTASASAMISSPAEPQSHFAPSNPSTAAAVGVTTPPPFLRPLHAATSGAGGPMQSGQVGVDGGSEMGGTPQSNQSAYPSSTSTASTVSSVGSAAAAAVAGLSSSAGPTPGPPHSTGEGEYTAHRHRRAVVLPQHMQRPLSLRGGAAGAGTGGARNTPKHHPSVSLDYAVRPVHSPLQSPGSVSLAVPAAYPVYPSVSPAMLETLSSGATPSIVLASPPSSALVSSGSDSFIDNRYATASAVHLPNYPLALPMFMPLPQHALPATEVAAARTSGAVSHRSDPSSPNQLLSKLDSTNISSGSSGAPAMVTGASSRPNSAPKSAALSMRPKRGGGGISCHHCKTHKDVSDLYFCTNILTASDSAESGQQPAEPRRCHKKYCRSCVRRLYPEAQQVLFGDDEQEWTCPACKGQCKCALCTRKSAGVQAKQSGKGKRTQKATAAEADPSRQDGVVAATVLPSTGALSSTAIGSVSSPQEQQPPSSSSGSSAGGWPDFQQLLARQQELQQQIMRGVIAVQQQQQHEQAQQQAQLQQQAAAAQMEAQQLARQIPSPTHQQFEQHQRERQQRQVAPSQQNLSQVSAQEASTSHSSPTLQQLRDFWSLMHQSQPQQPQQQQQQSQQRHVAEDERAHRQFQQQPQQQGQQSQEYYEHSAAAAAAAWTPPGFRQSDSHRYVPQAAASGVQGVPQQPQQSPWQQSRQSASQAQQAGAGPQSLRSDPLQELSSPPPPSLSQSQLYMAAISSMLRDDPHLRTPPHGPQQDTSRQQQQTMEALQLPSGTPRPPVASVQDGSNRRHVAPLPAGALAPDYFSQLQDEIDSQRHLNDHLMQRVMLQAQHTRTAQDRLFEAMHEQRNRYGAEQQQQHQQIYQQQLQQQQQQQQPQSDAQSADPMSDAVVDSMDLVPQLSEPPYPSSSTSDSSSLARLLFTEEQHPIGRLPSFADAHQRQLSDSSAGQQQQTRQQQ